MKRILVHAIEASAVMQKLGVASKLNADWAFLTWLHQTGRASATAWLAANAGHLGQNSTADLEGTYF